MKTNRISIIRSNTFFPGRALLSAGPLVLFLLLGLADGRVMFADGTPPASQAAPATAGTAFPQGTVVVGKAQMVVERPLPAFTLYTADDQAVSAPFLVQSGYWLLIYRDQSCIQCDVLMQALSKHPQEASRFVIVVPDISGANLLLLEEQYPALAGARWLRDVNHAFSSTMKIGGTPHMLGLRNGGLRWQHAGAPAVDAAFPAVIDSWLKYNQLPPNKFTRIPRKPLAGQKLVAANPGGGPPSGCSTQSSSGAQTVRTGEKR